MNQSMRSTKQTKKSTITKKPLLKKKATVRAFRGYLLNVRSRHPSHTPFKRSGIRLPFRSVVRLGSTWVGDNRDRIVCNSVEAIKTSASKLLMKQAFDRDGVKTASWIHRSLCSAAEFSAWFIGNEENEKFPIVAKHIHGSRGTGNYLLKTQAELTAWMDGKNLNNYIFEKFHDFNREYRLHVTSDGCFYTCRKVLKSDTPADKRWYRNDSNSNWLVETNPSFDKPVNWDAIVAESVKALKAVGLDVGAIDLRVQSAKNKNGTVRPNPEFIILETNSAPAFADITLEKYLVAIPELLKKKRNAIH